MNFPHATPDQWTAAQRIIRGILRAHGITGPDADDVSQQWTLKAMTREHRTTCPVSPTAAAVGMRRIVARYGIGRLLRETQPQTQTFARPLGRIGLDETQPDHVFEVAPGKAPASTNPATMAEAGETLAARMPRYAAAARAEGLTPAALALIAAGWGPLDDEDAAKASPSVPQCGPGYTPPARGCPGMATATDPNPASRAAAVQRCSDHLAALAAGSIQPRQRERTAEPTATEQAEQARQAWDRWRVAAARRAAVRQSQMDTATR